MNILQKIFTDHFEEMIYLQHPRDSVIENVEKMINCGNPAFGGAMYNALAVGISNMFLFVVIPVSALPAVTCIPLTGLLPCPLKSLMSSTDTASLLSPENYVPFFYRTVLF